MAKVECKACIHFRRAPYEARWEGCWHPDNMKVKQKERFLQEQQLPGDHLAINRRGDCPQFEARPRPEPLWRRLLRGWNPKEDPRLAAG